MAEKLTIEKLRKLVGGDAVAIRGRAVLEPAGGPGDKIFPPTHTIDKNEKGAGAKYAFEKRRVMGQEVECVLIDSVQSQANRMEEALQTLWRNKRLTLPVIEVNLAKIAPEAGTITTLTAPHRVADALLRDSFIEEGSGKIPFRLSELGKSFADASPRNAGPLFRVCPTGLIFGLWDSTGPKGGLGAKFSRALTSEMVGIGATRGVKTASRIDPVNIAADSATIYVAADPGATGLMWTWEWQKAEPLDTKKPLSLENAKKWGKKDKAGRPSAILHGNVAPSIDAIGGGVTIDFAEHTVVVSLAGLRRLGFTNGGSEARTVLAALALVAILAAEKDGHDLRSRCLLVPRWDEKLKRFEGLALAAVAPNGSSEALDIDLDGAIGIYEEAVKQLPESLKLKGSEGVPLAMLSPTAELSYLITESRRLETANAGDED